MKSNRKKYISTTIAVMAFGLIAVIVWQASNFGGYVEVRESLINIECLNEYDIDYSRNDVGGQYVLINEDQFELVKANCYR